MVNTKGLIIPLFYDVLPTHVRFPLKESSPYKTAFEKHYAQSYHKGADIDGWKDALHQICSRSGWSMDLSGGSEAQLIKTLVNDVIKTFDRVHFQVAKHPVGLESMTDHLIHKFKLNSEGEFLGLTKLQKKILKDLANHDGEVDSVEEGISLFRHRLRQKRVLLILDDVDGVEQLNALDGDWLAPGSGVIITSRDRHILHHAGVSSECIHEMSGLLINEGLRLFCWHAFLRELPTPTHKDLSERIVEACQGHPLSLEVIGSLLYDKQNDPDCWTEAFHNITLHPGIHERLKISYNALTEEEKEIFLDIACFFIGEHKMLPIVFWKSLYKTVHTAVHNLSLKLLIKIDDKGVFDMHDHLRDMGRSIAAERERECTRLWNADHLSRGVSNNNNFSRLRLNGGNSQRFETLYGSVLRLLHLENVPIAGITRAMLPPSLIWLRLQDCKKPSHFSLMRNMWRFAIQRPFHFRPVDLRILQTDGNISNLQYSLSYILGNLSQLQHLQLRNCRKLNKLPRTIDNLSKLQSLDLKQCTKLKKLPLTIGNLSQLQYLDLGWCTNLNNLPDTIGNLSQLQHLDLVGCKDLNKLPDTIGNLSQLKHLGLGWCTNLNNLLDTIGNLSQLQHLDLGVCRKLNNLPDTIGNLSQLQHLDLGECTNLNNLPDTIGNLSQLQHLGLKWCTNLNNLPDTIGNLSQLQHLDLGECTNLNNLPDTIGNLSQLQYLGLKRCTNLNNLPDTIGNLAQLQHLDLRGCRKLNNLPDTIGNLSQLQHLDLGECTNLNNLPDTIGNLSQLQYLDLGWCTNLNNLPDTIGNLSQLQHLNLAICTNLNNLPDTIGNLSQLQHLDLRWCTNLNNLPDTIGNLSQLQHLGLIGCINLNNLPDTIGNLSQLQYLNLIKCTGLQYFPDTIRKRVELHELGHQLQIITSVRKTLIVGLERD
ncbi:disease resistance protein TAO1 isoform X2 [Cryptomeria japonica]|uniref:disease resistance protein TAO1 isoform X2 n=1 Tax=Cryptomeria japonica TaxID=3369 RepID=UPI0027DA0A29|nr:disease resistance protein TAO1 isoform X2 [Cryptomeria japonica]